MAAALTEAGLSPRGRGSPRRAISKTARHRSIPAWAGEPNWQRFASGVSRVYPRVGGGAMQRHSPKAIGVGLSPRGRGSRRAGNPPPSAPGSIPAWAGEPHRAWGWTAPGQVYPRVGGGAAIRLDHLLRPRGLSPRGRGSRGAAVARGLRGGLSPRGRGSPEESGSRRGRKGSIPAWAGEPRASTCGPRAWRVYPRVGGGASSARSRALASGGLSPRGRGSQSLPVRAPAPAGSIPAWAGEPVVYRGDLNPSRVYPRVGGGAKPSGVV